MKDTIGIIGGSGPDATELLYHYIIDEARNTHGAARLEDYPDLVIASVPILQDVSNDDELKQVIDTLCRSADRLKAAGAKQLCFACNTHHLSINIVKDHAQLPFISMIDLVQRNIKNNGYEKVAVIGTSYTLGQALYEEPLLKLGVSVVDIGKELTEKSHQLIATALSGIPIHLTQQYIELVEELSQRDSFDAVILGCTEYSVLEYRRQITSKENLKVKTIDPLKELGIEIAKISYES